MLFENSSRFRCRSDRGQITVKLTSLERVRLVALLYVAFNSVYVTLNCDYVIMIISSDGSARCVQKEKKKPLILLTFRITHPAYQ